MPVYVGLPVLPDGKPDQQRMLVKTNSGGLALGSRRQVRFSSRSDDPMINRHDLVLIHALVQNEGTVAYAASLIGVKQGERLYKPPPKKKNR